ncbi:response regulator transcription factor [uncultured Slackia sp.]|uniref:response regulator transcription factor n=1 Tax=uncultured Slackia sp. TaxID=665903 RepID=UPI0025D9204F|nr:response regulator transcription factor [uncultured Slackia sp.]
MPRILAIDDDRAILDTLARVLERDGHSVTAVSCPENVPHMDLARFDLILCDVMMPNLDGFELVRRIRGLADCPIVFLTAKAAEEDAVYGLGLGADDYLRKPFGAAELRAKVAAHLRRERREHQNALTFGRVRIDLRACELFVDDARVPLTPSEYEICEFLARHAGQTFSRSQIRESVFGWTNDSDDATVTVHVGKARAKLKAAGVDPVQTVWGMGYKWQM